MPVYMFIKQTIKYPTTIEHFETRLFAAFHQTPYTQLNKNIKPRHISPSTYSPRLDQPYTATKQNRFSTISAHKYTGSD